MSTLHVGTLYVVEEILREERRPMRLRAIVEAAGPRLPTRSRTPIRVVSRDLHRDIQRRGEDSPFISVGPGRFALRELVDDQRREGGGGADEASASARHSQRGQR
jgi:hypothetical protein